MVRKILLDNKEFNFTEDDLPSIIHGLPHAGSSLFTVSLIANLYSQGEKILFLSGYPMAREELAAQIGKSDELILAQKEMSQEELSRKKVIFVPREDKDLFIKLANSLSDIKKRVVLIKNIDLFGEDVFIPVKSLKKLVLSGNLDECSWKEEIAEIDFGSKISFSEIPGLNKYEGSFEGKNNRGIVKLSD